MTNEERIRLIAYTAYLEEKIAEIKEAEEYALQLNEELKQWHQSEKGKDYAKLYQQNRQEILDGQKKHFDRAAVTQNSL